MNVEASLAGLQNDAEKSEEALLNEKLKQLVVESEFQIPANFREFRKAFEKCLGERSDKQEQVDIIKTYQQALE